MHKTGKVRIELLFVSTVLVTMACPLSHHDAVAQDIGASDDQAKSQLIIFRLDPFANERALPDSYPDVPGKAGGKLGHSGAVVHTDLRMSPGRRGIGLSNVCSGFMSRVHLQDASETTFDGGGGGWSVA